MVWAYIIALVTFLVISIIEITCKKAISRGLKTLGNKINFHLRIKSYAKSKTENVYQVILKIINEEGGVKRDFEYKQVEEIKRSSKFWGIIQLTKGIKKEDIEETIALQLPTISSYKEERKLLEPKLKKSLFDQITFRVATELGIDSITENIIEKSYEEDRTNELEEFEKIFKDKDKLELFRQEARRRLITRKGKSIEIQNIREFSKFVEYISKGIFKIITIFTSNVEYYFLQSKTVVKGNFKGLYLLARGLYIEKLNIVKDNIMNSVPKLKLTLEDEYDWVFPETGKSVKGKMCIFEKKK
ncbi:MAG: hypothetical protein KAU24_01385 [Candidatus Aenigmarchaeota archaeon]|nr:hypothetical protein [Candidatus Aenigmarchaeota archaeon]